MIDFLKDTLGYVVNSLLHNGLFLILGILIATWLKVYIDPERFKQAILKKSNVSIPGSVAFGAFTPFCACGTMAVIVSMLSTALPWGPIMAFLTSSPLMSPDAFVLFSGIISLKFAIALTIASLIIGLGSGYIAHVLEQRTDFLKDQTRLGTDRATQSCACAIAETASTESCGDANLPDSALSNIACCATANGGETATVPLPKLKRWVEFLATLFEIGVKRILFYFALFSAIGYGINRFVPTSIISALFNAKNVFGVPLAALIGLPLYVNSTSSIPLIKALMAGGASGGTMLAFMITGPGTSAGVVAGIGTVLKRRALTLYVVLLFVGAVLLGYLYDLILLWK